MPSTPVVLFLLSALIGFTRCATAAPLHDVEAVPHLDPAGQEAYGAFLAAEGHRAFAIAPGGAWAWKSGDFSAESVADDTLLSCESDSGRRCILYALDDKVVFDAKAWAGLWGPYLDRAAATQAPVGLKRGARFHDLAFTSPAGKPMKISDLRGKVVVLHFWGSWCPPCRRELPELQHLYRKLDDASAIQVVLLQVREDIADARAWAKQQRLKIPLYDSGAGRMGEDVLPLAGGKSIHDRHVAQVFPTTYILDRHGIVVFAHVGPIARWPQYLPLLRDVAAHSGR